MYHRINHETQSNPLLPGYAFNAYLVAGLTPIIANGPLDFYIDRPEGMKGYILNLTVKGQGGYSRVIRLLYVLPAICCYSRRSPPTITAARPTRIAGITAGSISGRGLTGQTSWSGTAKCTI